MKDDNDEFNQYMIYNLNEPHQINLVILTPLGGKSIYLTLRLKFMPKTMIPCSFGPMTTSICPSGTVMFR